jgi:Spy/CpxP family protein refolding chaperone
MKNEHRYIRSAWLIAAVLLAAAATAVAQGDPDPADDPQARPGFARLCQRLELSDAQQQAWQELEQAGRAERLTLRKDLLRLRHELEGQMMQDEPSAQAVAQLVERLGAIRTKLQQSRLTERLEMRKLLTDEQRDRLLTMRHDRRGMGREGRHPRPGRGFDGDRPGRGFRGDRDCPPGRPGPRGGRVRPGRDGGW